MLRYTKRWKALLFGVVLTMLIAGAVACGSEDPTPTSPPPPTATPVPAAAPTATPVPAAPSEPDPTPTPAPPAWEAEWEQTVAAAEAEGQVVVIVPPSEARQESVELFREKFPNIELITEPGHIRNFGQSVAQEQDAGIYQYDVCYGCVGTTVYNQWLPVGRVVNLREQLILPEVVDESKWLGGWELSYADINNTHMFGFVANRGQPTLYVDRSVIPESELPEAISLAELANPKWKGMLSWNDPSRPGGGSTVPAAMIVFDLEAELRSIFPDQEYLITASNQETTEFLVRGKTPMAIGIDRVSLIEFQKQGVGEQIVGVPFTEYVQESYGFGVLTVLKNAPNPNAAKVFANWWLTQEAQANHTEITLDQSRRVDVEGSAISKELAPGQEVLNMQLEINNPHRTKSQALIAELLN